MVKTIDSREQLPIAVLYYLSTRDGRTHRVAKHRNVRPAQEMRNHMLHIIVFSFPVRKTLKASISTGKERHFRCPYPGPCSYAALLNLSYFCMLNRWLNQLMQLSLLVRWELF